MNRHIHRNGHTLLEVAIATAIITIGLALATTSLVHISTNSRMRELQDELDVDVQTAMEHVKKYLRLSSLDEMSFYPDGSGPYTAISFPMARDSNNDGLVDLDANGKILWASTYIFHVWESLPNELRLTIFEPRDTGLTEAQRQQQINSVAVNGNGTSTHNGENAQTKQIFANLFDWEITPRGSIYDAYDIDEMRDVGTTLGSCVIGPGNHTFKFTVLNQNPASSGFKIGLDSLVVSPSYSVREAESQLPETTRSGPLPLWEFMTAGSWSANYQLLFEATEPGQFFTLTMHNDCWEVTNFDHPGDLHDDTEVLFDYSMSPHDFVVHLGGYGFDWWASEQTGATNNTWTDPDELRHCGIRTVIRGGEMPAGGWIKHDGGRCWVSFRSGNGVGQDLNILGAYIAECADQENPGPDTAPGTEYQLRFAGLTSFTVPGNSSWWTDQALYPIDKEKSYVVTFLTADLPNAGSAWTWQETQDPLAIGSYIAPGITPLQAAAAQWSTLTNVIATNAVIAVQALYTTYPTNGIYTSGIFDTGMNNPNYTRLDWSEILPSGTDIKLKVRSGSTNDLSDATAWTNITAMASPGTVTLASNRYVQVQAHLTPNTYGYYTPKLKDFTLKWDGPERVVDIGGTMTRGPDYGIFELRVDDELLLSALQIYLEIYNDVRQFSDDHRLRSSLTSEILPRNTGR